MLLSITDSIQTIVRFFTQGELFMIPLGITSIIALTIVLYKRKQFSANRILPESLKTKIEQITKHDLTELAQLNQIKQSLHGYTDTTLAKLIETALHHAGKPLPKIQQAVENQFKKEFYQLQNGIGVLDMIITIAPLIGLMSTAAGVISIFNGLGETTNYVSIARGIGMALNATIFGIGIAVLCIIAHHYFSRKLEFYTTSLETTMLELSEWCAAPHNESQ